MKLSPRITDALPLLKFVAVAVVVLAGVFWFNGLVSAKQELKIQKAQQNAIDFTSKQFEKAIEAEKESAARIRKDQDAQIARLSAKIASIETQTAQQKKRAQEVVQKNPEYKEKLDADGIAVWQAARDSITNRKAPK